MDPHAPPNRAALSTRWDALSVELTNVFQQGAGAILGTVVTRDAGLLSVYGVYHMVTVGLWGLLKMGTTGINSIFGNLLVSGRKTAFQRAYRDFECLYYMLVSILSVSYTHLDVYKRQVRAGQGRYPSPQRRRSGML